MAVLDFRLAGMVAGKVWRSKLGCLSHLEAEGTKVHEGLLEGKPGRASLGFATGSAE
jgi:hypothetical protein